MLEWLVFRISAYFLASTKGLLALVICPESYRRVPSALVSQGRRVDFEGEARQGEMAAFHLGAHGRRNQWDAGVGVGGEEDDLSFGRHGQTFTPRRE